MGNLSFYTTGEDMTNIIQDFIKSGLYYNAVEILNDGGMELHHKILFFNQKLKLVGDTREGDLSIEQCESNISLEDLLWIGLKTLSNKGHNLDMIDLLANDGTSFVSLGEEVNKHLNSLFSVFPKNTIQSLLFERIIEDEGYKCVDKINTFGFNGMILEDGRIVECHYHGHRDLFPVLYKLGATTTDSWLNGCEKTIHITSGQISCKLGYDLERGEFNNEKVFKTIFQNRDYLSFYGDRSKSLGEAMIKVIENRENCGGKYGKLKFVQDYYDILTPIISKDPIEGYENCLRTSPRKSLAGLLHSKFNITENSLKEIEQDWEQYKDVVKNNKLHYFYQQYLEGPNGVAHYKNDEFSYECSNNRHDIVDGKTGNVILNEKQKKILRNFCEDVSDFCKRDVQVEFVLHDNDVYVVQLRYLAERNAVVIGIGDKEVIAKGKSFTWGYGEFNKEEVLVVEGDEYSGNLLDKKAVIVRNNVEFAHILALSQTLKIPAIYGVGDIELPEKFYLNTTKDNEGFICKI